MNPPARSTWRDAAVAAPLAAAMSAGWAWARWPQLRAGVLPDTDDLMRLQQVRDWLGGQAFGDVTQHRLGIDGVAMHWSRLPDLGPAGIIAGLRPLVGMANAEMAALLIWPALLLAAFLFAAAAVARVIGARPIDATVVALLAYPATTVFAPGRIDHHNLQLVLLLAVVVGLTGRPTVRSGALAGIASVLSVAIGMETVPLLGIGIAAASTRWTADRREDARVAGLAVALGLGAVASLVFMTDGWRYPACDGFDRQSWSALTIGAVATLALALAGPRLKPRARVIALLFTGVAVAAAVAVAAPACLSPYGAVDPLLARLWLSRVAEAQGVLAADPRLSMAYLGLPIAAVVAGVFAERDDPRAERRIVLAMLVTALVLSFVQIRAAYGGAALAVPLLAEAIRRVRARGLLARLGTRIVATGIAWPLIAASLPVRTPDAPACDTRAALAALGHLPSARVLAPIDDGPSLIATTRHRVLAGPYHRNTAGNLLWYATMNGSPEQGRRALVGVDWLIACPTGAAKPSPDTLIGAIRAGHPPSWLKATSAAYLYRIGTAR